MGLSQVAGPWRWLWAPPPGFCFLDRNWSRHCSGRQVLRKKSFPLPVGRWMNLPGPQWLLPMGGLKLGPPLSLGQEGRRGSWGGSAGSFPLPPACAYTTREPCYLLFICWKQDSCLKEEKTQDAHASKHRCYPFAIHLQHRAWGLPGPNGL